MDLLNFSDTTLSLLSLLVVFLPLFSFAGIFIRNSNRAGVLANINIFISFIISLLIFLTVWNNSTIHEQLVWFQIGDKQFTAGILLNNLSVLMMVLVSGISMLVHIYSSSYMKGDPNIHKYWAYLGLFCFSMLGLVIADNLLLVYGFWELVGFSSFLLIGFWFTKDAASQAAKKAFIMNRIGDIGFLCGIMIIYAQFRTLDIVMLFGDGGLVSSALIKDGFWISTSGQMPEVWLSIAGLAFFFGAIAKSAQFPLHTWLPDAMEGPTSVSSLIHAATMVAAGVFLIGRIYPVFDHLVLNFITVIGVITALMGASIALTQNDIKRILAYSTISQLGFMIAAMGIGAYGESIFHLATHAFFKCLLFLVTGAVIHQLHHFKINNNLDFDHQDIRLMGGLRKQMPIAFITMCIAAAALAGLPLSSGYLSKDALLITSFEWAEGFHGVKKLVPYVLVLTSWMTVFYISRLIFKVFFGKSRFDGIQDAPSAMSNILVILSFCSIFILFSFNPLSYENSWILNGFVDAGVQRFELIHFGVPLVVNMVSAVLIYIAYLIYVKRADKVVFPNGIIYRFSNRAWYLDEAYIFLFVKLSESLSRLSYKFDRTVIDGVVNLVGDLIKMLSYISNWFDRKIVDGMVNLSADMAKTMGNFTRKFQSGKVQHYLITMLTVVLTFIILTYFL